MIRAHAIPAHAAAFLLVLALGHHPTATSTFLGWAVTVAAGPMPNPMRLVEVFEESCGWNVEGLEEAEEGGEADLAAAAFDAADLDGGKAAGVGELFLSPAALEAGLADVVAELLERGGHRVAIVWWLDPTGQNQRGKFGVDGLLLAVATARR